ncbi:TonB-dependent receptor [Gallaecimonas kandeliae]|uniref:TonB-dependent receptor n=1 Tax=Gallaecimonas kandeliae TaxID=3029055 RepID=UPI002647EEE1|nr:TonB-dependent receptor [Gallaecimonas kandeliae]WKE65007.1 TonB-dependent receptor [Gallaecimonas kandeliae]
MKKQYQQGLLLPSLLAATIAALLAGPAFADESQAQQDQNDTEVISVIGARIAYANNSTDDNIKSFSAPLGSVNDLIDKLPGVSVGEGGVFGSDDWSTTITMRGFSLNGTDQQLGMTVDGLPNGGSAYGGGSKANRYLLLEDTARVEVMQGTSDIASPSLDALGGTFNYVSLNPEEERGLTADYTTGDFDARKYYLRLDTGRFLDNSSRSYFSMGSSHNKRWIGSGSNGDTTDFHASYKQVTELDWGTLTGRISYDDTDETNYNGITLAQFKQNPRWDRLTWNWTGDPVEDQNFAEAWRTLRKNTFAYLRLESNLSDSVNLSVTPYYHHMKGRGDWLPPYQILVDANHKAVLDSGGNYIRFTQLGADGQPVLAAGGCDSQDCTLVSSYRHTHYGKDRYGTTAKLNWYISDANTLTAGLWGERQNRDEYRDWHNVLDPKVGQAYDNTAYWRQYDRTYVTDTFNYYLQDKWELGDLTLSAGARKYQVKIKRKDNFIGQETGSLSSNSKLLPMAGAIWQFTPGWELYGGYSKNFKAISDGILETNQDYSKLDAETAKNTDLGLRYLGNQVQMTAAIYKIKFANRITFIDASTGSGIDYLNELDGQYVNVGGIKSKGMEASINWQFAPAWSLYSALTYNDSEYSARSLVPMTKGDQKVLTDIRGNKVGGSPRKMAVVSLSYAEDNYKAGLSAKYTGDYFGDFQNQDRIPSHTVMDFYAGYHLAMKGSGIKGMDLTLNITNLGDTNYLAGGNNGSYYIGSGRTVTAQASLKF